MDPTGLPRWAAAAIGRLEFHARQRGTARAGDRAAVADALRRAGSGRDGDARTLDTFLRACLTGFDEAVRERADLAEFREDLAALGGLALKELDGTRDDRPVLAAAYPLMERPGMTAVAALVPGRVVFLAAVAATLPSEQGTAAAMLVNDLASLGHDLPLRALRAAAGAPPD